MNLFTRIKQSLLGGPIILFFIGLIFFGVGGGMTYYQIVFRQDAIQAQGEVISLSENCDDEGCAYSPVVRFTTLEGETIYYDSTFSSNPPEYQIREKVVIFYQSENPQKAIIAGEGGVLRFIFMGVGGLIILAGLVFFSVNLRNSLQHAV